MNCPYCSKKLPKELKRKTPCPLCKKEIIIRQGEALTTDDAQVYDWKRDLEYMAPNINKLVDETKIELTKRFGTKPSARDLIWGVLNKLVLAKKDPRDISNIYYFMYRFLLQEGKKKRALDLLKLSKKMELISYKESGYIRAVKFTNENDDLVCDTCKKLNNELMPLSEAIKNTPIPVVECENENCRCSLYPISDFDAQTSIQKIATDGTSVNTSPEGEANCPVCGANMGKPIEKHGLFGLQKNLSFFCKECKVHYKVTGVNRDKS